MRKVNGVIATAILSALMLTGCTQTADSTFIPPGAELAGKIVAPPAELPDRMPVAGIDPETFDYSICNTINEIEPQALEFMNFPQSEIATKTPSVKGEKIVSASQMPVTTIYLNRFSYLVKASLDSGAIVWFGSSGDLNETTVSQYLVLNSKRNEPIFGATLDAYNHFIWGERVDKTGPLMEEAIQIVKKYSTCFEPRDGKVPTAENYITPENAVNLVSQVNNFRSIDSRLTEVVGREFRWNDATLVDNGRYGSILTGSNVNGDSYCFIDYNVGGSIVASTIKADELVQTEYSFYATTDCSGTGINAISTTLNDGKTGVSSQNIDAKAYVDAFQDYFNSL